MRKPARSTRAPLAKSGPYQFLRGHVTDAHLAMDADHWLSPLTWQCALPGRLHHYRLRLAISI